MPTCPGCGRHVPHERLGIHERHCAKLSDGAETAMSVEALEAELNEVEDKFTRRILKLETRLQHELSNRQNSHQSAPESYNRR